MKEQFKKVKFNKNSKLVLDKIIPIIKEYQTQNITLTLRQLYYQLVARGYISNEEKEYKRVSRIAKNGRYSGQIDWDAIEDRIRIPWLPSEWQNLSDFLMSACDSYRLPRWSGQEYYIELICEKDALHSVLSPIARSYHIPFGIFRGYSSATSIYDLSRRVLQKLDMGMKVVLLYVGDHDPSGLDMLRDIHKRLSEFTRYWSCIELIPVALKLEDVAEYNLPPNPAKLTDTRAKEYIKQFGAQSWEVDALRPEVLTNLVTESIQNFLDIGKMNTIITKEDEDRKQLMVLLQESKSFIE